MDNSGLIRFAINTRNGGLVEIKYTDVNGQRQWLKKALSPDHCRSLFEILDQKRALEEVSVPSVRQVLFEQVDESQWCLKIRCAPRFFINVIDTDQDDLRLTMFEACQHLVGECPGFDVPLTDEDIRHMIERIHTHFMDVAMGTGDPKGLQQSPPDLTLFFL